MLLDTLTLIVKLLTCLSIRISINLDVKGLTRYTTGKLIMNTFTIFITSIIFAQAYGVDSYGAQQYSPTEVQTQNPVVPPQPAPVTQTTSERAPNTGLFGLPADTNYALLGGIVLIVVAVVGVIAVIASRARRKNTQDS